MLASAHFRIAPTAEDDWFDPILGHDTQLFVDPFLLFRERDGTWRSAHDDIIAHFNRAFILIAQGNLNSTSLPYLKALDILLFPEPKELCLGYTSKGTSGLGSGHGFAKLIASAISDAIARGLSNPKHFEELGVLNEGIGADRISDITCTILKRRLIDYTKQIAIRHRIALSGHTLFASEFDERRQRWVTATVEAPTNPVTGEPLLFVPRRFLRELPALNADDWWNHWENEQLRQDVNYEIMGHVDKATIVRTARAHPDDVRSWAERKESESNPAYDLDRDPKGVWGWEAAASRYVSAHRLQLPQANTPQEFCNVVDAVTREFKRFIEDEGGWLLLWDVNKDKPESAAQLLFRGIAKNHCKASNISIDREVDLGCGSVDFKFSTGFAQRALLEVKKLENGKFWNGLETQLPTYMRADEVAHGWFLIVRLRSGKQWDARLRHVQDRVAEVGRSRGITLRAVVVDSRPQAPASKR